VSRVLERPGDSDGARKDSQRAGEPCLSNVGPLIACVDEKRAVFSGRTRETLVGRAARRCLDFLLAPGTVRLRKLRLQARECENSQSKQTEAAWFRNLAGG